MLHSEKAFMLALNFQAVYSLTEIESLKHKAKKKDELMASKLTNRLTSFLTRAEVTSLLPNVRSFLYLDKLRKIAINPMAWNGLRVLNRSED